MGIHRKGLKDFDVGLAFLKSFASILPVLYPSKDYAALFTLLTLAAAASKEVINYYSGLSIGKFYGALLGGDESKFWIVFLDTSLLYIGQCLALSLVSFFSWCLYLSFRRNLVSHLHFRYFSSSFYYNINCVDDKGIDNPDQRLSMDVERASNLLATKILPPLLLGPFIIAYYTWKTLEKAGWLGVVLIYGYFLAGLMINRMLVAPISRWAARQEEAEGNYRYKQVSVRDHSEEIAFYAAEEIEKLECDRIFQHLLHQQKRLVIWRLPSQFFQYFFNYYGGVLSYAIQVIPVFYLHSYSGKDSQSLGTIISNNAFVFIYLVNSFTSLTDLAMSIGEFAGYIQRVTELLQVSPEERGSTPDLSFSTPSPAESGEKEPEALLQVSHVSFCTPSESSESLKNHLIHDLSFTLLPGSSLLVRGASGCGKSSLLRCIAQLWPVSQGLILLKSRDVLFLPQRSYLPVGGLSLREQLAYPRDRSRLLGRDCKNDIFGELKRKTEIARYLELLGLSRLVSFAGGLDERVHTNWHEVLSPGEQQRLCVCRLLLRSPGLAVLDEATSSLSESAEQLVYQLIKQAGISYISTGHRSTLAAYHDRTIELQLQAVRSRSDASVKLSS